MAFKQQPTIAIIGLGYVGLPLAVEFSKHYSTIGFDLAEDRLESLRQGVDASLELSSKELAAAKDLVYTSDKSELATADIYIVTVPTPIDEFKHPDLKPLVKASETIGQVLNKNDIVIYESTVYPGATEEDCVPVLEEFSSMKFNKDFFVGYSPERIVPGDKTNTLTKIKKITSGSTETVADYVDGLYKTIIEAGTFKASSIKVAEAAKVIENTQRDLNIAVVNEFAQIFNALDIDTNDVLEAAGTKWNFLPFKPGLVGGHCISVDPYYLCHRSQVQGYVPDILIAGRRINDSMGAFIGRQVSQLMVEKQIHIKGSNILLLGAAFKENCPDIRNTKVVDIANYFEGIGAVVNIYDPWVDPQEMEAHYGRHIEKDLNLENYDAVILAVAHKEFLALGGKAIKNKMKDPAVLYDIKSVLEKEFVDGRL